MTSFLVTVGPFLVADKKERVKRQKAWRMAKRTSSVCGTLMLCPFSFAASRHQKPTKGDGGQLPDDCHHHPRTTTRTTTTTPSRAKIPGS
jgi:hypothetical protein